MHIFLFEPRAERVAGLEAELTKGGFTVVPVGAHFFATDQTTLRARSHDRTAFLLADTPEVLAQVRQLRAAGCDAPILVMRDMRNARATAETLDAGADDDLVIPVKSIELKSRINSIARRAAGHAAESVTLGEAVIYFDGRNPEISGQPVPLSRREYAIFHELALGAGRVVSKSALYDAVYGMLEDRPFDKVIDVYICKIRKKFSQASDLAHPYIETVHGRGYKLTEPGLTEAGTAEWSLRGSSENSAVRAAR
ncbi:response regulator transcription factor [Roseivivax sp.]